MPLMPKRTKYRKLQKGRIRGKATRGNKVTNGEFGLQSLEIGLITSNQIEAASLSASFAVSSETPAISNITLPGFTGATQYSTAPFPLPIRVPIGLLVIGLSGKILIQT